MVGINDPNDVGEVRISFGAFLAAGSAELGSLSRISPDRPRVSEQNSFVRLGWRWLHLILSQTGIGVISLFWTDFRKGMNMTGMSCPKWADVCHEICVVSVFLYSQHVLQLGKLVCIRTVWNCLKKLLLTLILTLTIPCFRLNFWPIAP